MALASSSVNTKSYLPPRAVCGKVVMERIFFMELRSEVEDTVVGLRSAIAAATATAIATASTVTKKLTALVFTLQQSHQTDSVVTLGILGGRHVQQVIRI